MTVALDGKPLERRVRALLSAGEALTAESLFLDLVHVASLSAPKVASFFLSANLKKLPHGELKHHIAGTLGASFE